MEGPRVFIYGDVRAEEIQKVREQIKDSRIILNKSVAGQEECVVENCSWDTLRELDVDYIALAKRRIRTELKKSALENAEASVDALRMKLQMNVAVWTGRAEMLLQDFIAVPSKSFKRLFFHLKELLSS